VVINMALMLTSSGAVWNWAFTAFQSAGGGGATGAASGLG
jgi:hypothetical protein